MTGFARKYSKRKSVKESEQVISAKEQQNRLRKTCLNFDK